MIFIFRTWAFFNWNAFIEIYAIYSMISSFVVYLATQGVNPKEHPVKQELVSFLLIYLYSAHLFYCIPSSLCGTTFITLIKQNQIRVGFIISDQSLSSWFFFLLSESWFPFIIQISGWENVKMLIIIYNFHIIFSINP